MTQFSTVLIGHESLTIQCGRLLHDAGHTISAVVTRCPKVEAWAREAGVDTLPPGADIADRLAASDFDWLLSVANLDILPAAVLALPRRGAVNFHDGPLPAYAGLNAPVWARLAGETRHGVSWHMIEGGVDEGDIVATAAFDVSEDDTALSLNAKCYAAALDSFPALMAELSREVPGRTPQDLDGRRYFGREARPEAGGLLDFGAPAADLVRLVRALDHGEYWNPLCVAKLEAAGRIWLVRAAHVAEGRSGAEPGTVLSVSAEGATIATGDGDLVVTRLTSVDGGDVRLQDCLRVGMDVGHTNAAERRTIDRVLCPLAGNDAAWRVALEAVGADELPSVRRGSERGAVLSREIDVPGDVNGDQLRAAFAVLLARLSGASWVDFAVAMPPVDAVAAGHVSDWAPVRVERSGSVRQMTEALHGAIDAARKRGPFAADLVARLPGTERVFPSAGLAEGPEPGLVGPTALTLAVHGGRATLCADEARVGAEALDLYAARLAELVAGLSATDDPMALPLLPAAERRTVLEGWNDTDRSYDASDCVHHAFERQVRRTPDAEALAFEGESLTYAALNAAANRVAHRLREMGVGPGAIVGLHLPRSSDLVVAALGILKAGGAYLPMDPAYPADRTALFLDDSAARVVITTAELAAGLDTARTQILDMAQDLAAQPDTDPEVAVSGHDLAYMIYTSGSTGRPKGVMVEHRNVANFLVGMDERIDHAPGDVWLAVTSLSFDISVLELFWTLSRGFKLVLSGDEARALVSGGEAAPGQGGGMDFSLYYWGNDDGQGRGKYRSLLEGAKFADENGFCAVWTPERHFHAFGGPYPNPSVTGAAVAGFTRNIGVRAGSCVAPLHHTARIAEEWAVIDNLTEGRAGLAIASGWQPDDFVLRPENTPPENKPAMFRQIEELRRLWAGEPVAYPRKDGALHEVVTQPRPISSAPDLWVTTAGNPETWKEAGRNGCHVLTHLLGQSVDEVAGKIELYHAALREAGHDPADFKVTLMLHTYLAETRVAARETAREPMKDYLRSAAGLIKQYAWAFPAFKRPEGVDNAFQLDLGSLGDDELEAILDFAFERYFNDSGLFGTVEDALARVDEVREIGVTEIACLVDYGIDVDTLLDGLRPLARVVAAANADTNTGPAADDFSIAAQIRRHGVTHLQCTPSMARMIVMNDDAGAALARVRHLCLGGEALPGALVRDIGALTEAHVENMYGPTETTIWSTTGAASGTAGTVSLGRPIANTQVYVLDDRMEPQPIGVAGELYIGGDGVTRGYWQRDELTAERFVADPFRPRGAGRLYRTGDLARWSPTGELEYLGRADFQVKLRGHRIEPGEIEAALDALDGVRQSVAVVRDDTTGGQLLVAYLLSDGPIDEADLRARLRDSLPAQMIPNRFVRLDAFPLTPNRKIDRKALPALSVPSAAGDAAPQPPLARESVAVPAAPDAAGDLAGDVEAEIARIWAALLGVPRPEARANFFDLGGHSLLAVQAHREIKARLGVATLAITDIFRHPVLGDLVDAVQAKRAGAPPARAVPQTSSEAPSARAPSAEGAGVGDGQVQSIAEAMAQRREMRAARRRRRAG